MVAQLLLPAVSHRLVQLSTRYATAHVVVEAPQVVATALLRCSAPLQVGMSIYDVHIRYLRIITRQGRAR